MPATPPTLPNDGKEALGETRTDAEFEPEPIASFSPGTPLEEQPTPETPLEEPTTPDLGLVYSPWAA
jgi:hypothetical protein